MPDMGLIGWLVVGFIAGALSGMLFGDRTPRGCLPNIVIGILGGGLGGLIAREYFGVNETAGFLSAIAVAFVGAVLVRLLLSLAGPRDRGLR